MYASIPDCFMIAFAVGLLFGLVYEALRIVRIILRFGAAVFVCDVLFFILSAQAIMTLSQALGSYVRVYTVLGFGAGVFTYIVTVGRLFNIAENAASAAWRKAIKMLLDKIKKSFGKIAQKTKGIFGKLSKHCENVYKKSLTHLKFNPKMMYNRNRLEKNGESEKAHVIQAKVKRSS